MKIVVIGGGFAGLKLSRSLNNKKSVEVTLIDKVNYHQFQPLFYQVATANLDASNISFPLRKAFQKSKNVHVRLGEVKEIVPSANKVITSIGEFEYDALVIATGADTNFFGNDAMKEAAFPMKSTTEALQLRYRLLQNFEDAVMLKDKAAVQRKLSIVVVGGGATGVEISGALAEMKRDILPKDYPELNFADMMIHLVEGSQKTLGAMSAKSSAESRGYLERLGVLVQTGMAVKSFDGERVTLKNDETIDTNTVIWAAGIKGNVPAGIDSNLIARGNRIKVDRFNLIEGSQNIYAIGDVAYMETPLYPNGHPQVATVAITQAANIAANFIKMANQKNDLKEFEYHDKGSMATVGRNLAVVDIPKPKLHFKGFFAWLIWMGLHLILLVGVKNRMQVFINWVYKYFTHDQNLRLLFKVTYKDNKTKNQYFSS
jgi:NADH dehydrogenase